MYPSLLAEETRRAVTEYLSTTFALADDDARTALEAFLQDAGTGIFRGPYLRVRTPFHPAARGGRSPLDWTPTGFRPYEHQARAFERLSTRDGPAEPTIVTTGTGSGKTESFLVPLLDHAARARARGETGIKAIVLYPMNALVVDQGRRIAELLADEPGLRAVTAGVYIGGPGTHTTPTREALVDARQVLRDEPPDILLTNYKMLDLLLLRPADAPLWAGSRTSLRYLVLDEFHTYDGAQGTDVAMLLRRLGASLRVAEPGRPLGRVTPVATSATLGGNSRSGELRAFAETVFGTTFPPESVITEQRLDAADVVPDVDFELPIPDVAAVNAADAPTSGTPGSWRELAGVFLGGDVDDEVALGHRLRRSFLTRAVVAALGSHPLELDDAVDAVTSSGLLPWGVAKQRAPVAVEQALLRFLAVLSAARVDAGAGRRRPLLHVEVQLWIRELSRMLRAVDATPRFAWWHDGPAEDERRYLPAAHCRVCGRSGWQGVATELDEELEGSPEKVWRTSVTDRGRSRTMLLATADEPGARVIDPLSLTWCREGADGLPVLVTPDAEAAAAGRCPSCHSDDAVRFLGSSVATLVSVVLTQLFGSDLVAAGEKKTLVFTDSVQDAAHRAAFVEGRAFQFNLRSAVLRAVGGGRRTLRDVTRRLADVEVDDLYALAPPDFVRRLGLSGEWLHPDPGARNRGLLRTRLAFQAQLEVGLRSRLGRTLELTGALAVDDALDLGHYAALARATHENLPERGLDLPTPTAYRIWLLGLLDRLRRRGGIAHPWLTSYVARDGKRWPIWGGSPRGMQKFPRGRPAPVFLSTGSRTEFDGLRPRGDSWLTDWTERCLGVGPVEARALLEPVVRLLAEGDAPPLVRWTSESGAAVFGLDPEQLVLQVLGDDELDETQLRCPVCQHIHPVTPGRAELWWRARCPRMRCTGRLEPSPVRAENFYRALYRSGRLRHLVTHEHTALLDDDTRARVERAFARGGSPVDPNVLTCTPTLELGIDIGDLSAVGLASLPRTTASYLQRVGRAGRSTGNAFVVATVPNTPRDLYYLSEPRHLIDGEVTPPAAYLSAGELLSRQYLAYCLDRVAAGDVALGRDMPARLGPLLVDGLAEATWLRRFVDDVTERADELASGFLALYGGALDELARNGVRAFAASGLREAVARTVNEWSAHREELQRRLGELATAIADLDRQGHLDDAQKEDRRRWSGESKALGAMLQSAWSRDALTGLGELSLLPNYTLRDDHTELDVSLWWTTDDEGEHGLQVSEESFARGSRTALTEFAPGAVFYARGYRVEVDAVEIGPVGQPHWRRARWCPECGWGTEVIEPAPDACPRCHTTAVADAGAVHHVLELRRVSAVHRRDEAIIEDEAEDRTRTAFTTVTGVDVEPGTVVRAWQLEGQAFGAEYVRQATIRTANLGRRDRPGPDVGIAGERVSACRFPTCTYCGVVRDGPEDAVRHRGWCSTRRGTAPHWDELVLTHELRTQAVRLLLPVSTFHVDARLTSFKAALLLGLRRDFGGDPQHLEVVTARMPDEHGRTRRFLVLHDTVPGGTGYLDRLGDPDRMRRILTGALDVLTTCPCQFESRAACHRCLLGVAASSEVEHANRRVAAEQLAELLGDWRPHEVGTVAHIDISSVQLSELELRFREQLKRAVAARADQSWTASVGTKGEELDVRLVGPDGAPRRWTVRPLVPITAGGVATEPDFLFTRQDAQDAPVAVYLDGKAFHASGGAPRTADDARKRTALRDDGTRVWSLTWEDVEDAVRVLDGHASGISDLVATTVRNAVRAEVTDQRAPMVWGNPMIALLTYLADPSHPVWGDTALRTCLELMRAPTHRTGTPVVTSRDGLAAALSSWAVGQTPAAAAKGTVVLAPCAGTSGLPLAVLGSAQGKGSDSVGVVAVLDDRPSEVGGPEHDRRWRDWLRWGNVLQFLRTPVAGHTMPLRMGEWWTQASLDIFGGRALPLAAVPAAPVTSAVVDVSYPGWELVAQWADPRLHRLAGQLAEHGVSAPEAGDEVGERDLWPVELSWRDERAVVVVDEIEERDAWLTSHGWQQWLYTGPECEGELVAEIVQALGVPVR